MKHIIALDKTKEGQDKVTACFFFHGRGTDIQKTTLGLFRSILHQILIQRPEVCQDLSSIFKDQCDRQGRVGEQWSWHENDLQDFFLRNVIKVAETQPVRIYVDALDECGDTAARKLVTFFERVMKQLESSSVSFHLCFSCRHYPFLSKGGLNISIEQESSEDMEIYVSQSLKDLAIRDSEEAKIQFELIRKATNNFLWATLVINGVIVRCEEGHRSQLLLKYISSVPQELGQLYRELLQGVNDESVKLLEWVCFAVEPLSLGELRYAMVMDTDKKRGSLYECETADEFAESDDQMEIQVRALSKGLAEVREQRGEQVAQFIHESVKEYLTHDGLLHLRPMPNGNVIGRVHSRLAIVCLKYLDTAEIRNLRGDKKLMYVDQEALASQFPFLWYATNSWVRHVVKTEDEKYPQSELQALLRRSPDLLEIGERLRTIWTVSSIREVPTRKTLLHVAAEYNIPSILTSLLDQEEVEADPRDFYGRTPLCLAAVNGHEAVTRLLMVRQDVDVNSRDNLGQTPLAWAAKRGHQAIVQLLVAQDDVEVDVKDKWERSPLFLAVMDGHEAVVRLLIARDDVEVGPKDVRGRTPLYYAAKYRHKTIERLLRSKYSRASGNEDENK